MAQPDKPDLSIQSIQLEGGLVTIQFQEDTDVKRRSAKGHFITVPAELVAEEFEEFLSAAHDLWTAMEIAHRDPPDQIRG